MRKFGAFTKENYGALAGLLLLFFAFMGITRMVSVLP